MDNNLYVKEANGKHLVVLVYVDDIIFAGDDSNLCDEFAAQMQEHFEMSMMGELKYFLGLQIIPKENSIFLSQEKYSRELIKRFGMEEAREVSTPIATGTKLLKNPEGK